MTIVIKLSMIKCYISKTFKSWHERKLIPLHDRSKFILRTFLRVPSVIQNFIFFILNQKFNFYDYVTDLMHVNTKSNAIHLKIVKSMILETAVV